MPVRKSYHGESGRAACGARECSFAVTGRLDEVKRLASNHVETFASPEHTVQVYANERIEFSWRPRS